MTRVIFHIGGEKTGTTSIQASFSKNRDTLKERGILFPLSLGQVNHTKAYVYCAGGGFDELTGQLGVDDDTSQENFRALVRKELRREVNAADCDTIIVSNEHLSSRLTKNSELKYLRALFEEICSEPSFEILYYARPQWELIPSIYSTYIKTGGLQKMEQPVENFSGNILDHQKIANLWSDEFGVEATSVIPYQKSKTTDVLVDFCERIGTTALPASAARRNQQLSADAAEFLRLLNRHLPRTIDGKFNKSRGNIQEVLERFSSENRLTPTVELLQTVYSEYDPGNQELARNFFGGASPFDQYEPSLDTTESHYEVSIERLFQIMAHCWAAKQEQVLEQRATIERLRKRLNG